jgi:probable addiction module antidote protein
MFPWDAAEYLTDSESIAAYMTAALETTDPSFIVDALGVVARARGLNNVALDADVLKDDFAVAIGAGGKSETGHSFTRRAGIGVEALRRAGGMMRSAVATYKFEHDGPRVDRSPSMLAQHNDGVRGVWVLGDEMTVGFLGILYQNENRGIGVR